MRSLRRCARKEGGSVYGYAVCKGRIEEFWMYTWEFCFESRMQYCMAGPAWLARVCKYWESVQVRIISSPSSWHDFPGSTWDWHLLFPLYTLL